jgi:mono/diheme cytochrome c family protein
MLSGKVIVVLICGLGLYSGLRAQSVRDGVYTEAQANRGEALYPEHCDRCHGEEMEGDEAPALAGEEFLLDWKGLTLGDMFQRIRVAMPGDRPGSLTAQQTADLMAFILRANRFPAGKQELPSDVAALRRIPIQK